MQSDRPTSAMCIDTAFSSYKGVFFKCGEKRVVEIDASAEPLHVTAQNTDWPERVYEKTYAITNDYRPTAIKGDISISVDLQCIL